MLDNILMICHEFFFSKKSRMKCYWVSTSVGCSNRQWCSGDVCRKGVDIPWWYLLVSPLIYDSLVVWLKKKLVHAIPLDSPDEIKFLSIFY